MSNTELIKLRKAAQKAVPKNSATFTGKRLCWSLFFMKLQAFRPSTLLKRLQRRCFPVAKFLCNAYFEEYLNMAASELFLQK